MLKTGFRRNMFARRILPLAVCWGAMPAPHDQSNWQKCNRGEPIVKAGEVCTARCGMHFGFDAPQPAFGIFAIRLAAQNFYV
jgi:hypothetical protein